MENTQEVQKSVTGRIKARTTVNREIRRVMNTHATDLANIIIEKALAGDTTAMLAASNLMIEANRMEVGEDGSVQS